jgi:hypothetical protein
MEDKTALASKTFFLPRAWSSLYYQFQDQDWIKVLKELCQVE